MMSALIHVPCPALPPRDPAGHKGTFGRVTVVGGSIGMSGAVALSAIAALRSGSGLVTAVVPLSILPVVAAFEPSYLTLPLPVDQYGGLDWNTEADVAELIQNADAVAIGPGLGQAEPAAQLLKNLLATAKCPVVIDADGLNLLANKELLEATKPADTRPANLMLTPHPGEFSRLSGLSSEEIAASREQVAAEFAARFHVTVVLKGPQTVVTNGQQVFVNQTGNAGMATGGSGDVLTGILTSLIGQGMPGFEAACLAVHAHGIAGDLAAAELGQRGMIASDLLKFLPMAWQSLATEP